MMIVFLILGVALCLVVLVPGAFAAGLKAGAKQEQDKQKALENNCTHVWGPWEEASITVYDQDTGVRRYTVSGQKRSCDVCGFKVTRRVESQ